jgi:hydroxyacylglutathione hydrolase
MITGDTLFAGGSFGRVDFPGSSAKQIVESLKRLSTLDFQIAIPGHNQIIRHSANLSAERSYQIAKSWFNL